jgi:hypothetical protein
MIPPEALTSLTRRISPPEGRSPLALSWCGRLRDQHLQKPKASWQGGLTGLSNDPYPHRATDFRASLGVWTINGVAWWRFTVLAMAEDASNMATPIAAKTAFGFVLMLKPHSARILLLGLEPRTT